MRIVSRAMLALVVVGALFVGLSGSLPRDGDGRPVRVETLRPGLDVAFSGDYYAVLAEVERLRVEAERVEAERVEAERVAAEVEAARVAAEVAASTRQSAPNRSGPLGVPSDEHWYAIGRCEQGGNGFAGVDWTAHDGSYGGGLGFAHSTWAAYRTDAEPIHSWEATPAQQIAVANRVYAVHGPGAWGCKSATP